MLNIINNKSHDKQACGVGVCRGQEQGQEQGGVLRQQRNRQRHTGINPISHKGDRSHWAALHILMSINLYWGNNKGNNKSNNNNKNNNNNKHTADDWEWNVQSPAWLPFSAHCVYVNKSSHNRNRYRSSSHSPQIESKKKIAIIAQSTAINNVTINKREKEKRRDNNKKKNPTSRKSGKAR